MRGGTSHGRRAWAATLGAALVLGVACGGESGSSTTGTPGAGSDTQPVAADPGDSSGDSAQPGAAGPPSVDDVDPIIRSAADSLIAAHGEEGGVVALVSSLERGYSVEQIVGAAATMSIAIDGTITSDDQPVPPDGDRHGVLLLDGDTTDAGDEPQGFAGPLRRAAEPDPDAHELVSAALAAGWGANELITTILALSAGGYSFEQIVEALVLSPDLSATVGVASLPGVRTCVVLRDRGRVVRPAKDHLTGDVVYDTECNEALNVCEDDPLRDLFCEDLDGRRAPAETGVGDETGPAEAGDPLDVGSTEGAWTGSGTSTTSSESRSTTYTGSAVIELRDGVYTLSFETGSQSTNIGHDACSTTTSAFGQIDGTPDENGQILFVAEVTTDIVSDCPFYESSGGVATETSERTFVGRLRGDGIVELRNLVPGDSVELVWTPL